MRALLIVCLAVALSGCAGYRTSRLPPVAIWPPAEPPIGAPIALRFYGVGRVDTAPAELSPVGLRIAVEAAERAYRDSGLFSQVQSGWDAGGMVAEVGLTVVTGRIRQQGLVLASLTYEQFELKLRTSFRATDGTELGRVEVSEIVRVYRDPFVFFVMFSRYPTTVTAQVMYDLHRATLVEALKKGYLKPTPPAEARAAP